jgi:mono/diheme cytochrome c family protein
MMKKFLGIACGFCLAVGFIACSSDTRRGTGRVYMPDMAYSRALETYAKPDSSQFTSDTGQRGEGKIFYNEYPVAGTMARGDELPFPFAQDKPGDSTNYVASRQIQNPDPALTAGQMKEAERLYLVNCGVCHGPKLDGNGPLWKDGSGPFPSAPKNLMTLNLPEGQMFYSVTYGKNAMGSYASQLSTRQRWMIIAYVKGQQANKNVAAKGGADSTAAKSPATDSTKKAK